jgi:enoyl-CoA hydratase/carnithine racemase
MSVEPVITGDVRVSVDGAVVTVVIDRPAKRNALTQAMYRVLADTLLAADDDAGVGAVVVTGAEGAFTSGNDLADFAAGASLDQVVRFLSAIATVEVPVVAAVNGLAIGVGLTMLLHVDLVYVEPDAKLSVPFVSLGLVPEAASSLLLPRMVGPRHAAELLLAGRTIDGTEAVAWGLANAVASPVLDAALEAAHRLAAQPPAAVRATKALLRSEEGTVAGRMAEEMEAFGAALLGAEFAEVIAARRDRRDPVFGGRPPPG